MAKQGLQLEVRRMANLYDALATVRSNINASGRREFKAEIREISRNPIPYLRRIQGHLEAGNFQFEAQEGRPQIKSSGKTRPLVVPPIRNRIVQRAILNVLQSEEPKLAGMLGNIGDVLRTPTSVGGIPRRGVPYGINLVTDAIRSGATHFVRSDIREFFTRVSKSSVEVFIRQQTGDAGFSALLEAAMATELENRDEIKEWVHLFPLEDTGVPQGSSLSAFAGNIVLRDFDRRLNGRGICTVRYIDDFVVLGPSERAVRRAFDSAKATLGHLGMTAYTPGSDPHKAKLGRVSDRFDFLGCSIGPNGVAPARAAKQKLLHKLKGTLDFGFIVVRGLASTDGSRRAQEGYVQVLARTDRIIRGWGDSYGFADDRVAFHQLDRQIDALLHAFKSRAGRCIRAANDDGGRRAFGIALLKDTPRLRSEPRR